MANQYVNKVELADGSTLIDISEDTVAAGKMLSGYTAHDKTGAAVTGNIPSKTYSDITKSAQTLAYTVTVPSGHYASQANVTIPYVSVYEIGTFYNAVTGVVTFHVTSNAGYVTGMDKNFYVNVWKMIYKVGSLWATEDGTADPAMVLGFGTWTRVSPIEATWNRLKQSTTWAEMEMDAPTVYVWKRTA